MRCVLTTPPCRAKDVGEVRHPESRFSPVEGHERGPVATAADAQVLPFEVAVNDRRRKTFARLLEPAPDPLELIEPRDEALEEAYLIRVEREVRAVPQNAIARLA